MEWSGQLYIGHGHGLRAQEPAEGLTEIQIIKSWFKSLEIAKDTYRLQQA